MSTELPLSTLIGKTFREVTTTEDGLRFWGEDEDASYQLLHQHVCCETVTLEDVDGDLNVLVGSPILSAEEVSGPEPTEEEVKSHSTDLSLRSASWTFYKFKTAKGYLTARFFGGSETGQYSETAELYPLYPPETGPRTISVRFQIYFDYVTSTGVHRRGCDRDWVLEGLETDEFSDADVEAEFLLQYPTATVTKIVKITK